MPRGRLNALENAGERDAQNETIEGEDPNLFGPSNRRREARLPLTFPIEVSGFDRARAFLHRAKFLFGCGRSQLRFGFAPTLEEDAVVAIRSFHWQNNNVLDSRPVLFQVVRIENEKAEAWIVAKPRSRNRVEQPADINERVA